MHILVHVESNTGTVHLAWPGSWKDESLVDPYCNARTWLGDYWGKRWPVTDKPVTCKNCIAAYEKSKHWGGNIL